MDRIIKLLEYNPMLSHAKRSVLERLASKIEYVLIMPEVLLTLDVQTDSLIKASQLIRFVITMYRFFTGFENYLWMRYIFKVAI